MKHSVDKISLDNFESTKVWKAIKVEIEENIQITLALMRTAPKETLRHVSGEGHVTEITGIEKLQGQLESLERILDAPNQIRMQIDPTFTSKKEEDSHARNR